MTEPIQRYKWTSFGPMLDEDGPFVLASDAEAAIAAAEQRGRDEAMDMDPVRRREAYLHGQRDMLARCIDTLQALCAAGRIVHEDDALAVLRGLGGDHAD